MKHLLTLSILLVTSVLFAQVHLTTMDEFSYEEYESNYRSQNNGECNHYVNFYLIFTERQFVIIRSQDETEALATVLTSHIDVSLNHKYETVFTFECTSKEESYYMIWNRNTEVLQIVNSGEITILSNRKYNCLKL